MRNWLGYLRYKWAVLMWIWREDSGSNLQQWLAQGVSDEEICRRRNQRLKVLDKSLPRREDYIR